MYKEVPIGEITIDDIGRLAKKFNITPNGCWHWNAAVQKDGYGMVNVRNNSMYLAHRLIYSLAKGSARVELEIDHLCKNRHCVNPEHLEAVTNKENMQRRFGIGLCKRGHKLTPDNCYMSLKDKRTGRIGRQCRKCQLATKEKQ